MNDFTKEELIKIKDVMYGISFDDNDERILRQKIQSMIDSYCEHEYENSCCGCCVVIGCSKCDWLLE